MKEHYKILRQYISNRDSVLVATKDLDLISYLYNLNIQLMAAVASPKAESEIRRMAKGCKTILASPIHWPPAMNKFDVVILDGVLDDYPLGLKAKAADNSWAFTKKRMVAVSKVDATQLDFINDSARITKKVSDFKRGLRYTYYIIEHEKNDIHSTDNN